MDTFIKKIHAKSFRTYFIFIRMQNKKANKNVSTLSKTDGLIRCATYNMAGNLSQHPGDRKRKSPRPQNRYRSEIWGKNRKNTPLRLFRRMRQIEFGGNKKGAKPSSCPSISISYRDIIIFFTSNRISLSAESFNLLATSYSPQHLSLHQHQYDRR